MQIPRKLATVKTSPHFDEEAIKHIDRVLVDGVHVPFCVAYDMDAGWAFGMNQETKTWSPRLHGVVTVTLKEQS